MMTDARWPDEQCNVVEGLGLLQNSCIVYLDEMDFSHVLSFICVHFLCIIRAQVFQV